MKTHSVQFLLRLCADALDELESLKASNDYCKLEIEIIHKQWTKDLTQLSEVTMDNEYLREEIVQLEKLHAADMAEIARLNEDRY